MYRTLTQRGAVGPDFRTSPDRHLYRYLSKHDNPGRFLSDPRFDLNKGDAVIVATVIPGFERDNDRPTDKITFRFDYQISPSPEAQPFDDDGDPIKYISRKGSGSPIGMMLSHVGRIGKATKGVLAEGTWKLPITSIWAPPSTLVCNFRGISNWRVNGLINPILLELARGTDQFAIAPDGDWRTNQTVRRETIKLLDEFRAGVSAPTEVGVFNVPLGTGGKRKSDAGEPSKEEIQKAQAKGIDDNLLLKPEGKQRTNFISNGIARMMLALPASRGVATEKGEGYWRTWWDEGMTGPEEDKLDASGNKVHTNRPDPEKSFPFAIMITESQTIEDDKRKGERPVTVHSGKAKIMERVVMSETVEARDGEVSEIPVEHWEPHEFTWKGVRDSELKDFHSAILGQCADERVDGAMIPRGNPMQQNYIEGSIRATYASAEYRKRSRSIKRTGWYEGLDEPVYVTRSGGIGAHRFHPEINAELGTSYERYALPDPHEPENQARQSEAIRKFTFAVDLLHDPLPFIVAATPFMIAPTTILPNGVPYLYGKAGGGKSVTSSVPQSLMGRFGDKGFPLPAKVSESALADEMDKLDNAGAILDNIRDTKREREMDAQKAVVSYVGNSIFDGQSGKRLVKSQDVNRKGENKVMSTCVAYMAITAELRVQDMVEEGLRSRYAQIHVGPATLGTTLEAQMETGGKLAEIADSDDPSIAYAGYILQWARVAERLGGVHKMGGKHGPIQQLRDSIATDLAAWCTEQHMKVKGRDTDVAAAITLGWNLWLKYARRSGAITEAEFDRLDKLGWDAAKAVIKESTGFQSEREMGDADRLMDIAAYDDHWYFEDIENLGGNWKPNFTRTLVGVLDLKAGCFGIIAQQAAQALGYDSRYKAMQFSLRDHRWENRDDRHSDGGNLRFGFLSTREGKKEFKPRLTWYAIPEAHYASLGVPESVAEALNPVKASTAPSNPSRPALALVTDATADPLTGPPPVWWPSEDDEEDIGA
jgi:hypothetical protein